MCKNKVTNRCKGVTLAECIFVLGILVFLAVVLIPSAGHANRHSRRVICQVNLRQWSVVLNECAQDNDGTFPGYTAQTGGINAQDVALIQLAEFYESYDMPVETMFCPEWVRPGARLRYVETIKEFILNYAKYPDQYSHRYFIIGYFYWIPRWHSSHYRVPPLPSNSAFEVCVDYDYSGPLHVWDQRAATNPILSDRVMTRESFICPDEINYDFIELNYTSHYSEQKQKVELCNQVYADTHVEIKKDNELECMYGHGSGAGVYLNLWR